MPSKQVLLEFQHHVQETQGFEHGKIGPKDQSGEQSQLRLSNPKPLLGALQPMPFGRLHGWLELVHHSRFLEP